MSGESEDSGHYDDSEVEGAIDDEDNDRDSSVSHFRRYDYHSSSDDEIPLSSKFRRIDGNRDRTDRISTLHEPVITHILSFLPIFDSIRTSVLSRRWQYLWTRVPTLYFNYCDIPGYYAELEEEEEEEYDDEGEIQITVPPRLVRFVEFVDKTLVICDGSVKDFGVYFPYRKKFASNCHLWARFASRNGVEKFELVLHDPEWPEDDAIYMLPQFLYTSPTFRELHFSLCGVEPKTTVAWNSLKKLSIGYVNLSDDAIQRILAGTPLLEMLELYRFRGIKHLHTGNSSVKKLILRERWRGSSIEAEQYPLEISAPNVQSLEISGSFPDCLLVDIKSLVEAKLFDFYLKNSTDDDLVNKARCLLDSLAHVETLTLGTWATTGLAMLHTKHMSPRLLKCERLTLDTMLWKSHPLGIAILLRYFPLLQTLTATTSRIAYGLHFGISPLRSVEEEFSALSIPFDGFTLLKTVMVVGLWNCSEPFFQFIPIVLKNARILQKMIIETRAKDSSYRDPNELFRVAQKLLSFPRSSPNAELLVYE